MRDETTSAMAATSRTSIAPDTAALKQTVLTGAAAPPTTAVPTFDSVSSTFVTAEIPAVPASPNYGVLLPDGSVWYPGSNKKLPAPLLLRVAVWILAFATLLAAAGVFIIHYQPSWVNPLRHVTTGPAAAATGVSSNTKSAGSKTKSTGGGNVRSVTLMSPQPAGLPSGSTAYTLPVSSYTVAVSADHTTWVGVYPITNGQAAALPTQQNTISGGASAQFQENGPVMVSVGAGLATVKIYDGSNYLGTLNRPTPQKFWLEPKSAG